MLNRQVPTLAGALELGEALRLWAWEVGLTLQGKHAPSHRL